MMLASIDAKVINNEVIIKIAKIVAANQPGTVKPDKTQLTIAIKIIIVIKTVTLNFVETVVSLT